MEAVPAREAARLAEAVRSACVKAALEGYERARMDGLCDEGALEVAMDAVRSLDLASLIENVSERRGAG
jgi:hypothetical protein